MAFPLVFPRLYGRLVIATLLAVQLGACSPSPNVRQALPEYEGVGYTDRSWSQRERLLARSDFSVEVVKLVDSRRPRSQAQEPKDKLIYTYVPDELMGGVTYTLPVLFNKYLAYRPKMAKHYLVELEILKLRSVIAKGTLFRGGSSGRYQVELDVVATARRPDSKVAIRRLYRVALEQSRISYDGRSPSAELDRARMYDLVDDAVRETSERFGWDIRQKDARHWRIKPVPPAPVRIERVTPAGSTPTAPAGNVPTAATVPAPAKEVFALPQNSAPVVIQPTDAPLPDNIDVR